MNAISSIKDQSILAMLSYGLDLEEDIPLNAGNNEDNLIGNSSQGIKGQGFTPEQLNAITTDGWSVVAQNTDIR